MNNRKQAEHAAFLGIWVLIFIWVGAKTGDLRGDPLAYAVIAKKMALENQWLNPMMMDKPYLNKPPLFFWITAFFFKIFGVSYYVSKLPALIFSTLDIWLLYSLSIKWFRNEDAAFFTAFSFMSTRWVVRDFASARPESLLVFGFLLGLFAFSLMLERRKAGPYLFGLSFAIMVMTKFSMAFVLLLPTFIFAASRGKLREWIRWPHFFAGLLLGTALPAVWIIYFEGRQPGYFHHMLFTQTIERVTSGLDVRNSQMMYLKEVLFYYHPWLIFFIIGLGVMWKRKKEDTVFFTLIATFSIVLALQASTGKVSRYFIPVTLFMSMIAAHGVVRYESLSRHMKRILYFLGPVLVVFFWAVPVKINPQKYYAVHLAAELQEKKPSYVETFAFLKGGRIDQDAIPLVEWHHGGVTMDYANMNYFYLPESRRIWSDDRLADYAENGNEKIFLLAPTPFLAALPSGDRAAWTKIYSDETATLLLGDQRYR